MLKNPLFHLAWSSFLMLGGWQFLLWQPSPIQSSPSQSFDQTELETLAASAPRLDDVGEGTASVLFPKDGSAIPDQGRPIGRMRGASSR